jgi:hypothetical protein
LRLESLEARTVPTTAAVGTNFAGGSGGNFAPPDTDGAVGPNDYVQFINGRFAVFSKTGTLRKSEGDDAFWSAAGVSAALVNQGVSDPRIIYDPLSDRWFASEINIPNLGNSVFVGRSDSNDPAGTWHATAYLAVDNNTFGDYDTLGVDANGVYIGTINFSTTAQVSSTISSIPKADLLLSTPSVTRRTTSTDPTFSMGDILQGVNNFNAGQTASSHASVVSADHNSFGVVDRTTITGTGSSGATFGPTSTISVQPTLFPGQAHQPDGSQQIDTIDDRFGSRVWQVGDLIVGAHDIKVGSRDAIRITVLSDSQNTVVAEATISDSTYDYIFPSIALNQYGDMLIGFTRSGGSTSTNGNLGGYARYAFIDPANPAGGITVDPNTITLRAGAVNNYHLFGGSFERWGDYSATDVDPTDPTAFWTTQEWAAGSGLWGTYVAQVGVSPRITGVTSTIANGTYGVGAVIPITVTFNAKVTVAGTPQLALNSGAGAVAAYASGSGTNVLTFNYTVAPGENANDLNYLATTSLALNGGTIKRTGAANPDANLTLPDPAAAGSLGGSMNIKIDTRPRVTGGVSSPAADGTFGADAVIPITVTFSSPVDVTGTPQLALKLDTGPAAVATYASGSGTAVLTFNYTVLPDQMAADLDYASTSALTLNGGTIKDHSGGADAVLALPAPGAAGSLGANKNLIIDTAAPKVTDVDSPTPDGTYGFGQAIQVVVTFNKPADVTGLPELALNAGPGAKAVYVSGSGTTALTFQYTVGLADKVADLNYTSTAALTLPNGATIKEQGSSVNATLTLPATTAATSLGGHRNLTIDGTPGQPFDVTSVTANGHYEFNAPISITVTFTKPVVLDTTGGTPTLALNSGGTAVFAGTGGTLTAMTFAYTVGLGDFSLDLDAASAGALALNGATLADLASGTPAPLAVPVGAATHSLASNKNLDIDGRPGQPFDITSTLPNGSYQAGSVIPITVTFTKPVVLDTTGGTPTLALNSGGTAVFAGSTSTQLSFTYTVQSGDQAPDLDAASAGALALNGATLTDLASNTPAPLAVPVGADPHSLASHKNLVIDTAAPTVVEFRVLFGNRWYNLDGAARTEVPWKVSAVQVVFDEPVMAGTVRSLAGLSPRRLTGLKTNTLTWRFTTPITRGSFNVALVTAGADALKDSAGNAADPFTQAFDVLWGDVDGNGVVNALDEAAVRAAQGGPYQPGSTGSNMFADLSGDGIVNLIDVGITRSRRGTHL